LCTPLYGEQLDVLGVVDPGGGPPSVLLSLTATLRHFVPGADGLWCVDVAAVGTTCSADATLVVVAGGGPRVRTSADTCRVGAGAASGSGCPSTGVSEYDAVVAQWLAAETGERARAEAAAAATGAGAGTPPPELTTVAALVDVGLLGDRARGGGRDTSGARRALPPPTTAVVVRLLNGYVPVEGEVQGVAPAPGPHGLVSAPVGVQLKSQR
jgi:hypothetical protein